MKRNSQIPQPLDSVNAGLLFRVGLMTIMIGFSFNLVLFATDAEKSLQDTGMKPIVNFLVYGITFVLIWYFLEGVRKFLKIQFERKKIVGALAGIILMQVIAAGFSWFGRLEPAPTEVPYGYPVVGFFLISTLPGAFLEEWVFRYLVVQYARPLKKIKRYEVYFLSVVIFTSIHVPAYFVQYHWPLDRLWDVFAYGFFFLLIYLVSGNVLFTALVHGFINNPILFCDSKLNAIGIWTGSLIAASVLRFFMKRAK